MRARRSRGLCGLSAMSSNPRWSPPCRSVGNSPECSHGTAFWGTTGNSTCNGKAIVVDGKWVDIICSGTCDKGSCYKNTVGGRDGPMLFTCECVDISGPQANDTPCLTLIASLDWKADISDIHCGSAESCEKSCRIGGTVKPPPNPPPAPRPDPTVSLGVVTNAGKATMLIEPGGGLPTGSYGCDCPVEE
jgi:hypothetical protein